MSTKHLFGRLMVVVRIRPVSLKEAQRDDVTITAKPINDSHILIYDPSEDYLEGICRKERQRERIYEFDSVFGETSTQSNVFDKSVCTLVDSVLDGYNSSAFAYGSTGSGKTYTMMGTEGNPGIMPLTLTDLFQKIKVRESEGSCTYNVMLSYLEIYNEQIRDLLDTSAEFLELREDSKGVVVAGITAVKAISADDILLHLRKGNKNRSCESTGANEVSSRSHAVIQVFVSCCISKSSGVGKKSVTRNSKLSMIDLAGSERAAETYNRGLRMIEGANINRSLLALGNCINSLVDPKKNQYVNYRDSKLTRLLKDSLSGNCRTLMIANISPASSHFEETLNTLKYASRAIAIKTQVSQQLELKGDEGYANALQSLQQNAGMIPPLMKPSMLITRLVKKDAVADLQKELEQLFEEQLALKITHIDCEETQSELPQFIVSKRIEIDNIASSPTHSLFTQIETEKSELEQLEIMQRFALSEKYEIEAKMSQVNKKIKIVINSIPSTIESYSKQYLIMLTKMHDAELENLDLDLKNAIAFAALESSRLDLEVSHKLLGVYPKIFNAQKSIIQATNPLHSTESYKTLLDIMLKYELVHEKVHQKTKLNMAALIESFKERHQNAFHILEKDPFMKATSHTENKFKGLWNMFSKNKEEVAKEIKSSFEKNEMESWGKSKPPSNIRIPSMPPNQYIPNISRSSISTGSNPLKITQFTKKNLSKAPTSHLPKLPSVQKGLSFGKPANKSKFVQSSSSSSLSSKGSLPSLNNKQRLKDSSRNSTVIISKR